MKKMAVLCLAAVLTAAAPAGASVTFDFQGAITGGTAGEGGTADQNVSNYMTGVYGSSVTATGAAAWNNDLAGADWLGKTGTDKWIRSYGDENHSKTPGTFQISFDVKPVISGSFDAYVFEATPDDDFVVSFYDAGYGNRYSPNGSALLGLASIDWGEGVSNWNFDSSEPISLLVFSNDGYHDIGIDNLAVESYVAPIPAPSAVILGALGSGLVGWFRKRRAL